MRKIRSPILAAVRATTRGLVAAGVLDEAAERKFWATQLLIEPATHDASAARLVPADVGLDRVKALHAMDGLLEVRRGLTLDGLDTKDLVNEGRP